MKTIRKKIIDLLDEFPVQMEWHDNADLANFLLSHGVTVSEGALPVADAATERSAAVDKIEDQRKPEDFIGNRKPVQEWISVKDRLPEHGDVVLCFMKFGKQRILQWDNVSNWWLGYGHGDDWQKADVAHWCCLPQPPKGE